MECRWADGTDIVGRAVVGHCGGNVHGAAVTVVIGVFVSYMSIGAADVVVDAVFLKVVGTGLQCYKARQYGGQCFEM